MSEPEIEFRTSTGDEVQKMWFSSTGDFQLDIINKIFLPVIIFGRDIRQIKCFRNSFIYGFYLGVAGGLVSFLFTSKTLFSTNVAFASIWIGVFGYWIPCRYKYETDQLKLQAIKKRKLQKLYETKNLSHNEES